MPKASYAARRPHRVPLPAGTLQVNFCRNPACENFGRPPGNSHGRSKAAKDEPAYVMSGGGGSLMLLCQSLTRISPRMMLTPTPTQPFNSSSRSSVIGSTTRLILKNAENQHLRHGELISLPRNRSKSVSDVFQVFVRRLPDSAGRHQTRS